MSIKVGDKIKVKVKNITSFGAFVKCEEENGMIHISEVSNEYVKDIKNYLQEEQEVEAKVIGYNSKYKSWEFSIKKLNEFKATQDEEVKPKKYKSSSADNNNRAEEKKPIQRIKPKLTDFDFEDRLKLFLKKSEDKQIDIRRNLKNKQGIKKRKKKE